MRLEIRTQMNTDSYRNMRSILISIYLCLSAFICVPYKSQFPISNLTVSSVDNELGDT